MSGVEAGEHALFDDGDRGLAAPQDVVAVLGGFGLKDSAVAGVGVTGDPGALLEFAQVLAHALRGDERAPRQLRVGQALSWEARSSRPIQRTSSASSLMRGSPVMGRPM